MVSRTNCPYCSCRRKALRILMLCSFLECELAYITTETAHPFFDSYWKETRRRLELVWRAYYETDIESFLGKLKSEGITHFVFKKSDFFPEAKAQYFRPLDKLVKELAQKPAHTFAYETFLRNKQLKKLGVTPFRDRQSLVISVAALETHLAELKTLQEEI